MIAILLVSCSKNANQKPSIDYRTGTQGLVLSFPNGVPLQIYENDVDVRIPVQIENKGAFPQFDELSYFTGYIWIGGYDPNIVGAHFDQGDVWKQLDPEVLEGKTAFNAQGGVTVEDLLISVGDLPTGTTSYQPQLIFYLTYLYKTIASPTICVDPQPRSINVKDKVCSLPDFQKSYPVAAQGGPVGVTGVQQVQTSTQMIFKFDIQNFGIGQVIEKDLIDQNPNEGYDWRDLNKVYIEDVRLGDQTVDKCKPDIGEAVDLYQGVGHFQCTVSMASIGSAQAYTTPLTVTLSYGYAESQFRNIKILEAIQI